MSHQPRNFTIVDPRDFDGTPYEVAALACQQAAAVTKILRDSIDGVKLMVRNAELERQLAFGMRPDPKAWEDGPQAAMLNDIDRSLDTAQRRFKVLQQASGYDPKNPPKA